jgi:undecaprenyl-diphosphatase
VNAGIRSIVPVLVLLAVSISAGAAGWLIARRYPRSSKPTARPALTAAEKTGEAAGQLGIGHSLRRRLDRGTATGLALSLALLLIVVAGALLGVLALLVRTNGRLNGIDRSVAKWGAQHSSTLSNDALSWITQLGSIYVVIGLCVVLALVEMRRTGGRWIVPFLALVLAGEEVAATVIKDVVDRTRPAFNPAAATLGPSFPSGHSATAAAFYAAAALLLGRRRPRATRALITGAAVGIAVAVAASRVLLDVHWLTDVLGGLALGWAWFAICGVAFGGRLLLFGAGAEVAEAAMTGSPPGDTDLVPRNRPRAAA